MQTMTRDIHMTGHDLMGMVQLRPQDIGRYAIVPGPRDRLETLLKKIENPVRNFSFMEYAMYTGQYKGMKVTAINGGRFSADTAITTEILCCAQVDTLIRIGSCGALRDDIKIGDLIVVDGAIRGEGVTPYYVDEKFQPSSNKAVTDIVAAHARTAGITVHSGKVWSTDAILRETREHITRVVGQGAIAVDMVTSVFLTITQLHKVKAAVILAVSDNLITGQMGFMDPNYYMAEAAMIPVALNSVKQLAGK